MLFFDLTLSSVCPTLSHPNIHFIRFELPEFAQSVSWHAFFFYPFIHRILGDAQVFANLRYGKPSVIHSQLLELCVNYAISHTHVNRNNKYYTLTNTESYIKKRDQIMSKHLLELVSDRAEQSG